MSNSLTIVDPTEEECALIASMAEVEVLFSINHKRDYWEVPPWWHDSDYKQYELGPCYWTLEFYDEQS